MVQRLPGSAEKAAEQTPRRSWLAPALGVSLAAHAGFAAMLWAEQPPQPEAGAVVAIEIVSEAGAASPSASNAHAARGAGAAARPEAAPAPRSLPSPEAPRAAREPPRETRPQQEQRALRAAPPPAPERVEAAPSKTIALRRPAPPEAAPAPAAAEAAKPVPPETAAPRRAELGLRPPSELPPTAAAPSPTAPSPKLAAPRTLAERRVAEIVLRRPARIPPPPAKAPRLAGPPAAPAPRAGEHRPQTASVPIVAADAAPAAGPETGTTPPRYGFGSAANPIPRYPETARENGWEGVVMLSVSVGASGEALSVGISKSSGHSLLDAAAVDAVRRWRFAPARRAGVPVPGTATVPIRFRLED